MMMGIKRAVRKLFCLCGLDIRRFRPYQDYEWMAAANIRTILDIGANTGQFALMGHRLLPNAKLYSFEPLKDCYEQLKRNMEGVPQFLALNYALGDANGRVEMYRNAFSPSSSILPMGGLHTQAFPLTAVAEPEEIEIRRLDDVATGLDLAADVLIKIDVQGYEDKVILGGQRVISNAAVLIVETSCRPLYQGQALFDTIYDLLWPMGFAFTGCGEILKDPRDKTILQWDSIFMKKA